MPHGAKAICSERTDTDLVAEVGGRLAATKPPTLQALVLHNDIKIDNCQFGPASAGNGDLARSVPARHFLLVATRP